MRVTLYHIGHLAVDRVPPVAATPEIIGDCLKIDQCASFWHRQSRLGKAELYQRRVGPGCWQYLAVQR